MNIYVEIIDRDQIDMIVLVNDRCIVSIRLKMIDIVFEQEIELKSLIKDIIDNYSHCVCIKVVFSKKTCFLFFCVSSVYRIHSIVAMIIILIS